jgi:hypothetical protein
MGKLSDIMNPESKKTLAENWASTKPAEEQPMPIPAGEYLCVIENAGPSESRIKKTPCYKISFRVDEGEHAGHRVWLDGWLTEAALARTMRDLMKIGIRTLEAIDLPLQKKFRCKVQVTQRKSDSGTIFNEVRRFEVIEASEREPDAFAPRTPASDTAPKPATTRPRATSRRRDNVRD